MPSYADYYSGNYQQPQSLLSPSQQGFGVGVSAPGTITPARLGIDPTTGMPGGPVVRFGALGRLGMGFNMTQRPMMGRPQPPLMGQANRWQPRQNPYLNFQQSQYGQMTQRPPMINKGGLQEYGDAMPFGGKRYF